MRRSSNGPRCFRSSVKDKATADAICASLEANGVRVWIAPRDVMPGSDWGESIIEAIEQSKVMILVFSANSNASPQIKREIERSVNKGVTVVPFRIDDILPSKTLEYFISTQHWLDAFTPPWKNIWTIWCPFSSRSSPSRGRPWPKPRLTPHLPEGDAAPVHPAQSVAPPDEPTTLTLKIPKWKISKVLIGLVVGAILAGGAVWWLVDKRPPTQVTEPKKLAPPTGTSPEEAAREYYQKGKNAMEVDEKIGLFSKAIELNPKPGYYYIQRGRAYLNKKEYHKAIADLDKAVEVIPNSFAAYNLRGLAYDALDKQDQAMAEFNKAISLNPAYAEAF